MNLGVNVGFQVGDAWRCWVRMAYEMSSKGNNFFPNRGLREQLFTVRMPNFVSK